MNSRRHLIFATDQQLECRSKAKSWYIEGTFKLCRHPFTQLFTFNVFICREEYAKQVPLVFVLMSGKNAKDYRKVLREIRCILPICTVRQTNCRRLVSEKKLRLLQRKEYKHLQTKIFQLWEEYSTNVKSASQRNNLFPSKSALLLLLLLLLY